MSAATDRWASEKLAQHRPSYNYFSYVFQGYNKQETNLVIIFLADIVAVIRICITDNKQNEQHNKLALLKRTLDQDTQKQILQENLFVLSVASESSYNLYFRRDTTHVE